ncbi:MAG TPA: polysaccharide deacetylase family protein [Nitrososphaera sp.]|nr:polysaccharide deacetylase family protein [Nitrososphaera sp.]
MLSLGTIHNATNVRTPSCHCVAFRLDDIQDYFLNNVQLEVMEVFGRRNASLTIGIIGNYFGEDPIIVNYVKSRIDDPLLEVANHGWNHENLAEFSYDEQSELIKRTNEKIVSTLGTRPPVVLIAPYNILNTDTFSAAKDSGIRYISANVTYDPPPYEITGNQSLYRLPETALMGDLNEDDTYWITFDYRKVLAEVEYSLNHYGFAVVTLHPQDFAMREMLQYQNAVDKNHIKQLEMLLDEIEERRIKIVTISEIVRHTAGPEGLAQSLNRGKEAEEKAH